MHTRSAINRLKTAEGHLRGIQKMLTDDVYCIDVIRQIQAVQAALTKASAEILNNHLHTCLTTAMQGEDPAERERMLKELVDVYSVSNRITPNQGAPDDHPDL